MIAELRYAVVGEKKLRCAGREHRIFTALRQLAGVHEVLASMDEQEVALSIDAEKAAPAQVEARLKQLGYEIERLPSYGDQSASA
jgi:copper chaperone CopZ